MKLGLDRDDIVVKRRVRQKIEMIAEEDASTRAPTDADCPRTWRRTQRFVQPAVLTFEQVFLGPSTAGPEWCTPWRSRVRPCGTAPTLKLGKPTLLPFG